MTREELIARKQEIQRQLGQTQRRLEQARLQMEMPTVNLDKDASSNRPFDRKWFGRAALQWIWQWLQKGLTGPRSQQTKIAGLETQVASLMAAEYRVRCLIDQSAIDNSK